MDIFIMELKDNNNGELALHRYGKPLTTAGSETIFRQIIELNEKGTKIFVSWGKLNFALLSINHHVIEFISSYNIDGKYKEAEIFITDTDEIVVAEYCDGKIVNLLSNKRVITPYTIKKWLNGDNE